jgi:O-antigen ligase
MTAAALLPRYVAGTRALGAWSTIALAVSIPISTALDNILLAVAVLAWLAGAEYRAKLALLWRNPVFRAALLLFGLLLFGTLYDKAAPGDSGLFLKKYSDLVLIPVLAWAFIAARNRTRALQVFAGVLAVILLISCALKFGLLPLQPWLRATPDSALVFKLRITHNILMAFASFLFAWFCCGAGTRTAKAVWGALSALAAANVLLMVEGATGYFVLIGLVLLFGWQHGRLKGLGITVGAAIAIITVLSLIPGTTFQKRVQQILFEVQHQDPDRPAQTSAGYRLEYYRNTLALIGKNPVFGTGTGSFPAAYAELVQGTGRDPARNPHNQFLLITVQTGLVGLAALLWLLWQQWRLAPQLPTPLERGLAQGFVVMTVIVCMLNSALLDHTEGLLYAWLTALFYAGLESVNRKR